MRTVGLVLQTVLPALLFRQCQSNLILTGKTAKPRDGNIIEFTEFILLPFLRQHFGIQCSLKTLKQSFTSQANGKVVIMVDPLVDQLPCISLLERGEIVEFQVLIWNTKGRSQKVLSVRHC